jgi:cyclophilin family peptidyl-prolyl cis-trans isomerase
VAVVIALAGGAVVFGAFTGAGEPEATPSPTASPTPTGEPGTRTGAVDPEPGPERVACDGRAPRGALNPKPQFNRPPEVLERNTIYTATLETSCGRIVIRLFDDRAPETVNSFVFLSRQGFYDATRIHRIDRSIDIIQGGDPTGTGTGGPGYTISDEVSGEETYGTGVVAMANSGQPDSGGSQFFIVTGDRGHNLDANATYTIFGEIVEGLEVARTIQRLEIQGPEGGISGQQPANAVYIERITISTDE